MKLKNHLGEIFELRIEKYHLELSNIEVKLFNSDWLDTEISINNKYGEFSKPLECFLIEDLERILDWISGIEQKTSKKYLYFLDTHLVFMRTKRNNVPFMKVIYHLNEIDFVSWDLEINTENVLNFKNKIQQNLKNFPCRCGMEHNYDKV
jgi:hypothetical protein